MHTFLRRILSSAALLAVAGALGCSQPSDGNATEKSVYGNSLYDQSKLPYQQNGQPAVPTQAAPAPASAPAAEAATLTPEQRGKQLYQQLACVTCHSLDGNRGLGPTWKGVYGREEVLSDGSKITVNDAYIRESIQNPTAKLVQGFAPVMPSFAGRVTPQDEDALIAFMKTLK